MVWSTLLVGLVFSALFEVMVAVLRWRERQRLREERERLSCQVVDLAERRRRAQ